MSLVEWILWGGLALLVLAIGGVALLVRKGRNRVKAREAEEARAAAAADKDLFAPKDHVSDPEKLVIGNIVEYGGTHAVRGCVATQQGSYGWKEYYLEGPNETIAWLGVERDGDLKVTMWHDIKEHNLTPDPTIKYEGVIYRREERGTARYICSGTTDLQPEAGLVDYVDYRSSDGLLLSLERYYGDDQDPEGVPWELSKGSEIYRPVLLIYPGVAKK
ncbi:MAG TPA: DUF4178 domain-containing protein [Candidatus Saccharimonadales bacterium]